MSYFKSDIKKIVTVKKKRYTMANISELVSDKIKKITILDVENTKVTDYMTDNNFEFKFISSDKTKIDDCKKKETVILKTRINSNDETSTVHLEYCDGNSLPNEKIIYWVYPLKYVDELLMASDSKNIVHINATNVKSFLPSEHQDVSQDTNFMQNLEVTLKTAIQHQLSKNSIFSSIKDHTVSAVLQFLIPITKSFSHQGRDSTDIFNHDEVKDANNLSLFERLKNGYYEGITKVRDVGMSIFKMISEHPWVSMFVASFVRVIRIILCLYTEGVDTHLWKEYAMKIIKRYTGMDTLGIFENVLNAILCIIKNTVTMSITGIVGCFTHLGGFVSGFIKYVFEKMWQMLRSSPLNAISRYIFGSELAASHELLSVINSPLKIVGSYILVNFVIKKFDIMKLLGMVGITDEKSTKTLSMVISEGRITSVKEILTKLNKEKKDNVDIAVSISTIISIISVLYELCTYAACYIKTTLIELDDLKERCCSIDVSIVQRELGNT